MENPASPNPPLVTLSITPSLYAGLPHLQNWEHRQFAAPSPPFVKLMVLARHGTPQATWVETGTFEGDTTAELAKSARKVYSVEPEPGLYAKAVTRFADVGHVEILNGASEAVFPTLLPTLSGDVNFWLDGHYSAGLTFKGAKDTPIVEELSLLGAYLSRYGKVAVLVDDVRCFNPTDPTFAQYPSIDYLVDWARANRLRWHIEHDIFVAKNF